MAQYDCEETKAHVHEYLHNELRPEDQADITSHLALCDSCEATYDIEVYLNQVIQRSCDEAPPAELAQRVIDHIRKIQSNH
jgi:anti-sigma factor (TIGR02949 family)